MAKFPLIRKETRARRTCLRQGWVWLWLGTLLVFALAGCRAGRRAAPDTVPEPTRVIQATPLPTATLTPDLEAGSEARTDEPTLVFWSDPARAPVVAELGRAFAAAYGVEVVVEAKELSAIREDFRAALSRQQDMPDIFLGGHDWIPLLAANGILVPMDLEAFAEEYAPSVLAAMSYDGLYYGVPVEADSLALVYNPVLLPEPPATWQELQRIARQQVDAGHADLGLAVNVLSPFDVYPVLTGFAGDLFRWHPDTGLDVTAVTIDSEASQRAMAWLQDMENQGLADFDRSRHEMHLLFGAGRLPMLITGPWSLPLLDEGAAAYDVAAFPEGGRSFVNVRGYMINAYAQDPYLAWLFLSHQILTADAMRQLYEAHPASPPAFLPAVAQIHNQIHQFFAHLATQGTAAPNIPEMDEIWRIWGQAQYAIFVEDADRADTLSGAQSAMSAVLQARRAHSE